MCKWPCYTRDASEGSSPSQLAFFTASWQRKLQLHHHHQITKLSHSINAIGKLQLEAAPGTTQLLT
jgi:hypothetical protein